MAMLTIRQPHPTRTPYLASPPRPHLHPPPPRASRAALPLAASKAASTPAGCARGVAMAHPSTNGASRRSWRGCVRRRLGRVRRLRRTNHAPGHTPPLDHICPRSSIATPSAYSTPSPCRSCHVSRRALRAAPRAEEMPAPPERLGRPPSCLRPIQSALARRAHPRGGRLGGWGGGTAGRGYALGGMAPAPPLVRS